MRNEQNRAAGMRSNGTVNKPVLIFHIRLSPSHGTCGCHMLNVFH
jgi:hypothetical protein